VKSTDKTGRKTFGFAELADLPNHPAPRRALKLRDASGLQLFERSEMRKPRIESRAMKYKPRIDREKDRQMRGLC